MNRAVKHIKFNGSTHLPYDVRSRVQEKQRQLRTEIIEKSQNVVQLGADDLNMDYLNKLWETKVNALKAD